MIQSQPPLIVPNTYEYPVRDIFIKRYDDIIENGAFLAIMVNTIANMCYYNDKFSLDVYRRAVHSQLNKVDHKSINIRYVDPSGEIKKNDFIDCLQIDWLLHQEIPELNDIYNVYVYLNNFDFACNTIAQVQAYKHIILGCVKKCITPLTSRSVDSRGNTYLNRMIYTKTIEVFNKCRDMNNITYSTDMNMIATSCILCAIFNMPVTCSYMVHIFYKMLGYNEPRKLHEITESKSQYALPPIFDYNDKSSITSNVKTILYGNAQHETTIMKLHTSNIWVDGYKNVADDNEDDYNTNIGNMYIAKIYDHLPDSKEVWNKNILNRTLPIKPFRELYTISKLEIYHIILYVIITLSIIYIIYEFYKCINAGSSTIQTWW